MSKKIVRQTLLAISVSSSMLTFGHAAETLMTEK
ncbi:hypothetical protein F990_00318 [Acinetobacter tjernbergiae DSM 14971 = CIP 107465]|uniref:Uncharacterized protein n=1 Tax=Acinetobacter tjernbergiae DSM 14971 = CIP 107465 TaxID=1120928 RepID=V2V965_9GAMM|nr:hypothetical protein F990_00318 [Acinetobacter tjernbergiae DSM 14971 = CIP 107465]